MSAISPRPPIFIQIAGFTILFAYAVSLPVLQHDTIRYDIVYLTCSKKLSPPHGTNRKKIKETRSVAAGFGRHGMPSPASRDTGTAFVSRIKKRQR